MRDPSKRKVQAPKKPLDDDFQIYGDDDCDIYGASKKPLDDDQPVAKSSSPRVANTIKKNAAKQGLSGHAIAMAVLACIATAPTIMPPIKKKPRLVGNTPTSLGTQRGTPNLHTQKLVERRLREKGLWNQAVAFHKRARPHGGRQPDLHATPRAHSHASQRGRLDHEAPRWLLLCVPP